MCRKTTKHRWYAWPWIYVFTRGITTKYKKYDTIDKISTSVVKVSILFNYENIVRRVRNTCHPFTTPNLHAKLELTSLRLSLDSKQYFFWNLDWLTKPTTFIPKHHQGCLTTVDFSGIVNCSAMFRTRNDSLSKQNRCCRCVATDCRPYKPWIGQTARLRTQLSEDWAVRWVIVVLTGWILMGKLNWRVWYVIIFLCVQFCIRLAAVSYRGKKVRTVAFPLVRSVNKSRDAKLHPKRARVCDLRHLNH